MIQSPDEFRDALDRARRLMRLAGQGPSEWHRYWPERRRLAIEIVEFQNQSEWVR